MATATQNWLGLSINFDNVEDKTSEGSGFELLPEGFYKATIKNVVKGILGQKEKQALTVTLELEDSKKEIQTNLFLPEQGDSENAIKFKNENLRNFFTRLGFAKLTKEEYSALNSIDINTKLKEIQLNPKGEKQFIDIKTLVHIKQEPFIACDKETGAIRFTDKKKDSLVSSMPRQLLKEVQAYEAKGVDVTNLPVFLFSNKIAAHGFGFYNDYDSEIELKNSKAYDFVQSLGITNSASSLSETVVESDVPQF